MKRIIFLLTIIFLFYPVVSFSTYIIYLKNGGQIEADSYRKEGNQIKYMIHDGEVGIGIEDVLKIKEVTEEPMKKEQKEEIEKTQTRPAEFPSQSVDKEALRRLIENKKAELSSTDQMISDTEKKLEFIKSKENELNDVAVEIGRPKYKLLIREKRALETKKEQLAKDIEELLKDKDDLIKNLANLRDRRKIIEDELSDFEYQESYGTSPPVPAGR